VAGGGKPASALRSKTSRADFSGSFLYPARKFFRLRVREPSNRLAQALSCVPRVPAYSKAEVNLRYFPYVRAVTTGIMFSQRDIARERKMTSRILLALFLLIVSSVFRKHNHPRVGAAGTSEWQGSECAAWPGAAAGGHQYARRWVSGWTLSEPPSASAARIEGQTIYSGLIRYDLN